MKRIFLTSTLWGGLLVAGGCVAAEPSRIGEGMEERELAFVASARGQVYYWTGCEAWRSLAAENLIWFSSPAEAEAAGYRASTARGCTGPEHRMGPSPIETGFCTVEAVIDGDTVVCAEAGDRIRLLLIDAPELAQGEAGEAARSMLQALLPLGTRARVEIDVQQRDRYGRILAYLHTTDGRMVNEVMAASGYALVSVHPPNVRHVEGIRAAVEQARVERRGLWSRSAFECAPADYRAGRCR